MTFDGLQIAYDHRVLEPRPWTARQSRWAEQLLVDAPPGDVLELCSGAGQIGLRAVAGNDRRLVMVDIDPVACTYARRNAAAAGLASRVDVREAALAEAVLPDERFALVVADPPWVHSDATQTFPDDPLLAIDGGVSAFGAAGRGKNTGGRQPGETYDEYMSRTQKNWDTPYGGDKDDAGDQNGSTEDDSWNNGDE